MATELLRVFVVTLPNGLKVGFAPDEVQHYGTDGEILSEIQRHLPEDELYQHGFDSPMKGEWVNLAGMNGVIDSAKADLVA